MLMRYNLSELGREVDFVTVVSNGDYMGLFLSDLTSDLIN